MKTTKNNTPKGLKKGELSIDERKQANSWEGVAWEEENRKKKDDKQVKKN